MAFSWTSGILLDTQSAKQFDSGKKLSSEVRAVLDSKDNEKIENMVMDHLETSADDIDFFGPILRALIRRKDHERASVLLQFVVDALRDKGNTDAEVELLKAVLDLWPGCELARDTLVGYLQTFYNSPGFNRIATFFGLSGRAVSLDELRLVELWLRFDEGRAVYMQTRGVGRVYETNPKLGVVRIKLGPRAADLVSFKLLEAERLLEPLQPGHFLADKFDRPAEFAALAESDPGELLRRLFTSINRDLNYTELKEILSDVIPDAKWSSWWSKAKQNPHLSIGAGSKPQIRWSDTAPAAQGELLARFAGAPAREKLDMLRKYADRSPELASPMVETLTAVQRDSLASDPSLALEIAIALDKLHESDTHPQLVAAATIVRDTDPVAAIAGIQDRALRKKALSLAREIRSEWGDLFARMLRSETDAQCIAYMYDSMRSADKQQQLDQIVRETISDPKSAPRLFLWLCKEMMNRPELEGYIGWDTIQQIIAALGLDDMKPHYAALRKLFDIGEVGDRAAAGLNTEQAQRLLALIDRDIGIEEFRREHLRKLLHDKHPHLNEAKIEYMYVTAETLQLKREEFEKLVRVEIPQNSEEIKKAREYGDLRENFEYHAARARQEFLSSRAKTLHDDLARARIIDPATVDTSLVSLGTRVRLDPVGRDGEPLFVTILGPWDSDSSRNVISYSSQAALELLGSRPGSEVAYNGLPWKIGVIEAWTA